MLSRRKIVDEVSLNPKTEIMADSASGNIARDNILPGRFERLHSISGQAAVGAATSGRRKGIRRVADSLWSELDLKGNGVL